ncbi:hypothetical protein N7G274_001007 [Stereocaulon virgatum]|uniref:Transmembrane protein n=1 Tax=Stereocaulon virgatum TaxID=373712 RepID=A0ABR4AN79_9LECA
MNRSISTTTPDSPDVYPNDSASNSRRFSRTFDRHSIPTTQATSWSRKLQRLNSTHICHHQRAIARVTKWLSGPAFDTPLPDPPFSNPQMQGTSHDQIPPPAPHQPNAPQHHAHNYISNCKCIATGVADIALITLGCVAFVPFTIVIMTITTVVLAPRLIWNGPDGVGRDKEKGRGKGSGVFAEEKRSRLTPL